MPNTSFVPFSDLPLLYCFYDYDHGLVHKHRIWRGFFSFNGIKESIELVETCTDKPVKPIQPLYSKQVSYNRLLICHSPVTHWMSLQTQGLYSLSGQSVSVCNHSSRTEIYFLVFRWNSEFPFVPIASFPVTGHFLLRYFISKIHVHWK